MRRLLIFVFVLSLGLSSFGQSVDSLMYHVYYHYDRDEFVEVVQYSLKAIEVFEDQNDSFDMAGCYNVLGVAYQRLGQLDKAIDAYNRCNELMEEVRESDPDNPFYLKNIRYTNNNIAYIYSSMGEYDQSIRIYQSCLESLGEPHDTVDFRDAATYLQNLADAYIAQSETMEEGTERQNQLEEAVLMAEQALDYSRRYNDYPVKLLYRMTTLSKAYFSVGRIDEAYRVANEGLKLCDGDDDLYQKVDFLLLLGGFHLESRQYKEAEEKYVEAMELARQRQYDELESEAVEGAYLAAKQFDKAKALDYLEQSNRLKDSIFNERQQQLIRDYQARYELAEKDHQIQIEQKRNEHIKWVSIGALVVAVLLAILLLILIRLNRANRLQKKTLESLNDTKDKLLSITSHDVKTSVIAQNMVLDQLYRHCDSMDMQSLKENILVLKTSSDTLKDQLSNILQWVMGQLGDHKTYASRFNLSQLLSQCTNYYKAEIESKQLAMTIDIDPGIECNDDQNTIRLVAQNVLSNAIKFSHPNGRVAVSAAVEGQQVWVTVKDEGIGIAPEQLQELTNKLVDSRQGTVGETGSGLGLLVSRQLLERSKGSISIESEQNKGTTVRFSVNT